MTTRLARKAAFLACVLLALSCVVSAVSLGQSFPSHMMPLSVNQDAGFYSSERLPLFAALATGGAEVLRGVTALNFTSARASLVNYTGVVSEFNAWQHNSTVRHSDVTQQGNISVLNSISTSQNAYSVLIGKSTRYQELYSEQTGAGTNGTNSTQSVQNALEMKRLNSDIKTLWDQINATNELIHRPTVLAGLNESTYEATRQAFDAYITLLDDQLTNVTNAAFQNTTTTLLLDKSAAAYGDHVQISGTVRDGETGVANGTVTIVLGGGPIATLRTNATGNYTYDYFLDGATANNYSMLARYNSLDQPYKASNSSIVPFSIANSSTTDTLRVKSGSLLSGRITFEGTVATDRAPVSNAGVTLYADGKAAAYVETDVNGSYHVDYSVSRLAYLTSVFSPSEHTFYTVFHAISHPLGQSTSDTISEPVFGSYVASSPYSFAAITAMVMVLLVATTTAYARRSRTRTRIMTAAETVPSDAEAPLLDELEGALPISFESEAVMTEEGHRNVEEVIRHVTALSDAQDNNGAIIAVYSGALAFILMTERILVQPSMAHWEKCAVIEERIPGVRDVFRELTYLYELASYSGRDMAETHVQKAIEDLTAIEGLVQRTGDGR